MPGAEETALHLVLATAPQFGAVAIVADSVNTLDVRLDVPLASGAAHPFHLRVECTGFQVRVFEREPRLLPEFCIERHINDGGSFCLGWSQDGPLQIRDEAAAVEFWSQLVRFLEHQIAASKLGRWPGTEHARAHGEAAEPQERAEVAARALGPKVHRDFLHGDLLIRAVTKGRKRRLELWRRGRRVARVHASTGALVSLNLPCICDRSAHQRVPIGSCGDHAKQVAALVSNAHERRRLEREYIEHLRGAKKACCGTLKKCGLRERNPQMEPRRAR